MESDERLSLLGLFLESKEFSPVYFAELFVILNSGEQLDRTKLDQIMDMALKKTNEGCIYYLRRVRPHLLQKLPITSKDYIYMIKKGITDILDANYDNYFSEKMPNVLKHEAYGVDFNKKITYVRLSSIFFPLYYLNCMQQLRDFEGLTRYLIDELFDNVIGKVTTSVLREAEWIGVRNRDAPWLFLDETEFPGSSAISLYSMIPEPKIRYGRTYDIECIKSSYMEHHQMTDLAVEFFQLVAKRSYMDLDNLIYILERINGDHCIRPFLTRILCKYYQIAFLIFLSLLMREKLKTAPLYF